MNEPAFAVLYARTAGPLLGYLRKLTGNAAVAEDLMQDAYIRFLSAMNLPDAEDHQRHYLFRIATNLARDYFRRQKAAAAAPRGAECVLPPSDASRDVWTQLGRLPPRDRELLLLAYVEGLSHAEIAQVTGLMRASVRPLLYRARRRFAAIARGEAP